MPLYEYECKKCVSVFSALGSIKDYQAQAKCPECNRPSPRIIGTAPQLNTMNPGQRKAYQVNEKSAHEPGVRNRHRCNSHCGCGSNSAGKSNQEKNSSAIKQQQGKRPWMLGH